MVEPLARHLRPVDEERKRDGRRKDPDEEDEGGGAAVGEASLEGEDDSEEAIAGDERQREGAGDNGRHWKEVKQICFVDNR